MAPQRLEDLERDLRVRRILHVDADEETGRFGALENLAQVVDGAGLVDVETELREFQRDVPFDAGLGDGLDDACVRPGGGFRFLEVRHALAQQVEREAHAPRFDDPRGLDGFLNALARDEPAAGTLRAARAVARYELLERSASGAGMAGRLRRAIGHQGGPPRGATQ